MKKLLQKIVNVLRKKGLKISFAESCTGGLLSSSITSIINSSKVFTIGLTKESLRQGNLETWLHPISGEARFQIR